MAIDTAHYTAQLLLVVGNGIWAMGDIFDIGVSNEVVFSLFTFSHDSLRQTRWYSAWVLLLAYVPIAALYCVWLPLTCAGRINAADM